MNQNLIYRGSFSTAGGNERPLMNYGAPTYTEEQNQLYNRLLIGRNAFTKDEWYQLNSKKKKKIVQRYKKAQAIFNEMKQEALLKTSVVTIRSKNKVAIGLLNIINTITSGIKPDPEFLCTMSFKDLGITKEMRIERLIEEKLLPSNFYSLG